MVIAIAIGGSGAAVAGHARPMRVSSRQAAADQPEPATYTVTYKGSGSFSSVTNGDGFHVDNHASFQWALTFPHIVVLRNPDGSLQVIGGSRTADSSSSTASGEWSMTTDQSNNDPPEHCSRSGSFALTPWASVQVTSEGSTLAAHMDVGSGNSELQTMGGTDGNGPCDTDDFFGKIISSSEHIGYSADGTTIEAPLEATVSGIPFGQTYTTQVHADANQRRTNSDQDCFPEDESGATCSLNFDFTGTVTLQPDTLQARMATPGAVERTHVATLDASPSTPRSDIRHYEFHFKPGGDCPDGTNLKATSKEGDNGGQSPTTHVRLLCSLSVTVTVTDKDGKTLTSSPVVARVTPRKLHKIPFDQPSQGAEKITLPFGGHVGTYGFGLNRDAKDWHDEHDPEHADHWLSPYNNGAQLNESVELKKLDDPSGPFNGFWYIDDHHLKVDRVVIINRKLLPDGEVGELNDSKPRKAALARIVHATEVHERIHGKLVHEMLGSDRFHLLAELEKAFDSDDGQLLAQAIKTLNAGETKLKDASAESKVHARMRAIFGGEKATIIRDGNDGLPERHTYVLATLGDVEKAR